MKSLSRNADANVTQVHQKNILDRLQHRLKAAKSRSDEGLVQQLEQEMKQARGTTSPASIKVQPTNMSKMEVANAHRQNLLENVKRRLEVARANGNSTLVSQLERELQQLT
jgi:prolyl oligopeptidase PreP (S9A serine peptidase family)